MSRGVVVVTGDEAGAATREASAVAQQPSATQQGQVERVVERAVEQAAANAAAAAARAQAAATGTPQVEVVTEVPTPGKPRITIERDGKTIVIPAGPPPGTLARAQHPDFVLSPQIPTEAVVISIAFFIMLAFIAVGLPLARAFARRMDRQGVAGAPASFPADVADRIERIEQAVEAIAIEVERVSEGQRFTTKLLSDMRAPAGLSAGAPGQFGGEVR